MGFEEGVGGVPMVGPASPAAQEIHGEGGQNGDRWRVGQEMLGLLMV